VRPLLLPALRQLWRDDKTLQLGVDPARAVVLSNVDAPTAALLALLDGRHTVADITAHAAARGVPPAAVSDLLGLLARCGAVVDGEPTAGLPRRLPSAARRRLGPDLAALSLSAGGQAGALLARRSRQSVVVHATGRIGPAVAAVLAASGVGRVSVQAAGVVGGGDPCVGGLLPADEHRSYALAAADAVRRARGRYPAARPGAPPGPGRPCRRLPAAGGRRPG
jgi:hypothetical protein